MINYQVTIMNEGFEIRGDFPNDLTPIAIPDSCKLKRRFASFFLHKRDIEKGMSFLRCISMDKHEAINEGLFIAGLNAFIKCFKSDVRAQVSDSIFTNDETKKLYTFFNSMRNKHFMHDENGMLQTLDFLLVNLDKDVPAIFNASVVWNSILIDYQYEASRLLNLIGIVHNHLCSEIDKMAETIVDEFKDQTKKELLGYGSPTIKIASYDDLHKSR